MLKDIDAFPLKMKNELHALGQLFFLTHIQLILNS